LFRGLADQAARIAAHPDFARTDLSRLTPGSLDAVLPEQLRAKPGARANLFGMTETFGSHAAWPLDQDLPPGKEGSCGRPLEGVRVRIVDPDTRAALPAGETGAIEIGGRNLMRGICGREREDVCTPDGWYAGGDLGWLDEDGFLFFAGRADDMIKVKGVTIYPVEVEAALQTIPGVARPFATDIIVEAAPAIGAAVVLAPGADLDHNGLVREAKSRLSAFKIPSRWVIMETMESVPRGASGKIDKAALKALLMREHRAGDV
jgi:acyl-CoA synthetase (AMP-forming)/AMP-acid ligase II